MTKTAVVCAMAGVVMMALVRPPAAAAAQDDELVAVPRISQDDFRKALDAGRILVVDVRDAGSYANGHVRGAVSIPLDELRKHVTQLKAERRPIVTYCA